MYKARLICKYHNIKKMNININTNFLHFRWICSQNLFYFFTESVNFLELELENFYDIPCYCSELGGL